MTTLTSARRRSSTRFRTSRPPPPRWPRPRALPPSARATAGPSRCRVITRRLSRLQDFRLSSVGLKAGKGRDRSLPFLCQAGCESRPAVGLSRFSLSGPDHLRLARTSVQLRFRAIKKKKVNKLTASLCFPRCPWKPPVSETGRRMDRRGYHSVQRFYRLICGRPGAWSS